MELVLEGFVLLLEAGGVGVDLGELELIDHSIISNKIITYFFCL